jgi:hypothetical protein
MWNEADRRWLEFKTFKLSEDDVSFSAAELDQSILEQLTSNGFYKYLVDADVHWFRKGTHHPSLTDSHNNDAIDAETIEESKTFAVASVTRDETIEESTSVTSDDGSRPTSTEDDQALVDKCRGRFLKYLLMDPNNTIAIGAGKLTFETREEKNAFWAGSCEMRKTSLQWHTLMASKIAYAVFPDDLSHSTMDVWTYDQKVKASQPLAYWNKDEVATLARAARVDPSHVTGYIDTATGAVVQPEAASVPKDEQQIGSNGDEQKGEGSHP